MAKRIVVCSDGTGNTAIKGRGTNVFKLFEAVDLNGHRFDANLTPQIAIYDDGVGTEDFKARYSISDDVRVVFIGVWDTVDARALPFHIADVLNAAVYRFKFPDHRLSSIVDRACQALSSDDPRRTFEPRVWDERGESNRE